MKVIYEEKPYAVVRVTAGGKVSVEIDLVLSSPAGAKGVLEDALEAIVMWQLSEGA